MNVKIKATTPCYKFINASPEAQLEKIREEVEEVAEAWATYSGDKTRANLLLLLMELTDVKACVNTAMAQIHKAVEVENNERCAKSATGEGEYTALLDFRNTMFYAKKAVIEKNLRRGYYTEDREEEEHE